jgi:hypothetical protein
VPGRRIEPKQTFQAFAKFRRVAGDVRFGNRSFRLDLPVMVPMLMYRQSGFLGGQNANVIWHL